MTRTQFLALLATASLTAPTSIADSLPEVEDTILVTATRTERAQFDVVPSTIVITREDIENQQALDLAEILRFHAGLDIGRNGGPGQVTSVFIRGTNSNHTLVLVDGVEINPGTAGGAPLQNITPELIERIEIVKGPRSSLYGSEAIGGVINIITRKADKTSIQTSVGLGSFGTKNVGFNAAQRFEDKYVSLGVDWLDTDGFPTLASATEDRGYDNVSLNLKAGANFFNTDFDFSHLQANGKAEYFNFFGSPLDQDYENQITSLKATRNFNSQWNSQLIVANGVDKIDQNQSEDFVETDRFSLDWFNTYQLSGSTSLLGGAYYAREKVKASSFGTGYSDPTEIKAIFFGTESQFGDLDILANVRFTDHDTAGNQTSWNIEGLYPINSIFKVGLTAGSAFRAPNGSERFGFGGNPNLQTEESDSIALSLLANTSFGDFRLEAFQNNIDNLINYVVTDFVTFAGENRNINEAKIKGAELTHNYKTGNFDIVTTALVQSPRDETSNTDLLRRARRSLTNEVRYNFAGGHNLGLQSLITDKRADFGGQNLGGYSLFNLTGKYQLNERVSLFGKIENLTDKEYQTVAGYNQAERAYYLNLRLAY